jgi:hypothetical protein
MFIKVIIFALLVSFAIFLLLIYTDTPKYRGWKNYWKNFAKVWKEDDNETNSEKQNVTNNIPSKKGRSFRITRIEYPQNNSDSEDNTPLVVYYAQIYGKRKWVDGFTAEYNNNKWWSLCKSKFGNIYEYPYMGGGYPCPSEEDALQLIEDYKKEIEKEILEKPIREKQLKEGKEFLAKLNKERYEEALKNAPRVTHTNID